MLGFLSSGAKEFQSSGPDTAKLQGPIRPERVRGTVKSPRAADRRRQLYWFELTGVSRLDRYGGARPCKHLKTSNPSLYWILCLTGSQCKRWRRSSEIGSNFRFLRIRRAAELSTDWSLLTSSSLIPATFYRMQRIYSWKRPCGDMEYDSRLNNNARTSSELHLPGDLKHWLFELVSIALTRRNKFPVLMNSCAFREHLYKMIVLLFIPSLWRFLRKLQWSAIWNRKCFSMTTIYELLTWHFLLDQWI